MLTSPLATPSPRLPFLVAAASAALLAFSTSGCTGDASADQRPNGDDSVLDASTIARPLSVSVMPVPEPTSFEVTLSYQGQIEARRSSRVGFDLAGTVTRVRVDEGDIVNHGETLAQLDTSRQEARLRQLEAAVTEAETGAALAGSTLERVQRAYGRSAVAIQEVDEARQARDAAAASLDRAKAQRDLVAVDIEKSRLHSPFRAIVLARHVDEGQVVAPGTVVLELVEIDKPRARVGVPPAVARELQEEAQTNSDSSYLNLVVADRQVAGKLLASLPQQRAATRTVDLLLELDEPLGSLRIGETVRLERRETGSATGYELPVSALTESSRGLWSSLVAVPREAVGADSQLYELEQRPLEVVEIDTTGSDLGRSAVALVRGAIEPGEMVVKEGLQRLVTGQIVTLDASPGSTSLSVPAVEEQGS